MRACAVLVVGAAVWASLAVTSASPADACSPPPWLEQVRTVPADGATGVPTNTRVVVEWAGAGAGEQNGQDVAVRAVGGAEVASSTQRFSPFYREVFVVTMDAPLAPATTYEILAYPTDCVPVPACSPKFEVIGTFETSDTSDQTSPQFAGLTGFWTNVDICSAETKCTCCFEWARLVDTFRWSSATDESTPEPELRYNVYRADTDELVVPLATAAWRILHCSGNDIEASLYPSFVGPDGDYYVRAVDRAGNEDDNRVVHRSELDCALTIPDAGPAPGSADAGHDGGLPADDDTGGGCCGVGGDAPASSALLALLVTLALRRRERHR